jgi:hypothetical protein
MEALRYLILSLALGIIVVWAGENLFWFMPPADLRPIDLFWTVIAYSIACAVALNFVILTGVGGWPAAFLGGAVMGYMAEGVIVGTIYSPLPFYWVWTPLAWHALISGGLVLGVGRAADRLGPGRMALIWAAFGLAAAYWAQYWTSERADLPTTGMLALYLIGFGLLVVAAQVAMDRLGAVPRPHWLVMAIAPAIALFVWVFATVSDLNPLRVILPLALLGLWWIMRRLGGQGARVSLGAPVPVWQHALVLIAPAVAVALAPLGWAAGLGTLGANWIIAIPACLLSVALLARLAWRAART